jgi:FMN phosphatase YigB (HAD superfamily)
MEKVPLVIMLDVDNTLLNNDRAKHDMDAALDRILGHAGSDQFWQMYEAVRKETGVVDLPLTLTRFYQAQPDPDRFRELEAFIDTFPYDRYVYPYVPQVLAHLSMLGTPLIVSDGDPVYQAYKIRTSGLGDAVHGHVLIFDHKDQHLAEIEARYPAARYVMVDDKDTILDKIKRVWGPKVVTVHVCQGKYAALPDEPPAPDIEIDQITDLLRFEAADFRPRSG